MPKWVTSLAVVAGVTGAVAIVGSFAAGTVSYFWRAQDRCSYSVPPEGFQVVEPGVVDSFPTLFPIGYGCTWKGLGGVATESFPDWTLTTAALVGAALILLAGFILARKKKSAKAAN